MLNQRWVLTACHCLQNITAANLSLNYGAHHKLKPKQKRKTKRFICHEYFSGMETLDNDIGLIQNEKEVPLSEHIMPACIPSVNTPFPKIFEAAGWGLTENDDYPDYLKFTYVPLRSEEYCSNWWGDVFNSVTKFCAGFKTGTCTGDSGGGVVARVQGLYFVEGITSFSFFTCGLSPFPSVYTRVRHFKNWIDKNMNEDDYCEPLQD